MGGEPDDFAVLMRRLQEGSEEAARTLFERYGPHILRVVRRKLHRRLRPKFDSLDFAQDVWASFFIHDVRERAFDGPDTLIAFLVEVAHNKVVEKYRQRLRTEKYDVKREERLDSSVVCQQGEIINGQPTPSQVAVAREQWDQLLDGQPAYCRHILVALREGKTHAEIARELGVNEKTIRRLLRRLDPRTAS